MICKCFGPDDATDAYDLAMTGADLPREVPYLTIYRFPPHDVGSISCDDYRLFLTSTHGAHPFHQAFRNLKMAYVIIGLSTEADMQQRCPHNS